MLNSAVDDSLTVALAEARLAAFARMKFEPDKTRYNNVITQLEGTVNKELPFQTLWRVVMTGKDPGDLLEKNYLMLYLIDPCTLANVSWIKPGKILPEVTITTAGAIAAIDFTSSYNIQYVEFDAGWYGPENSDISDARAVNLDPALKKDDGLWGATNYIGDEPELEFFDNVPTVWDETLALHARIGEYGVIARKKGEEWFIGGINGANATKLDLNFSFLYPDKEYSAKIYSDNPSVNTRIHVRIDSMRVDKSTIFPVSLRHDNGIAMHLLPDK